MKTINVLGTTYTFKEDDLNNELLAENDGVCELYEKEIVIRKMEYMAGSTETGKGKRYQHVILHELAHFLYPYHNKDFYDFITIHMPDWQDRKKQLDYEFVLGI